MKDGHLDNSTDQESLFSLDKNPVHNLSGLGGCNAEFSPWFEEKILEDRGEYELVQDRTGRGVLYFKGRRQGFMPEYISHPVTDFDSFQNNCLWRMNPLSPERYTNLNEKMENAYRAKENGMLIRQYMVGGYMYLRSLMGPEGVLYMFYDNPELIHECIKAWFELADYVTAVYQQYIDIDELQFDEDICYKNGALISPSMIEEFLFPYYRQLISNVRSRNKSSSHYRQNSDDLHLHLATDGDFLGVIDQYKSIGFNVFSPCEAAAGMDVIKIKKLYPNVLLSGGFDKRILASGRVAICNEIERIMPFMQRSGGYIPTCDHGVPEEVDFDDYVYFRRKLALYGV